MAKAQGTGSPTLIARAVKCRSIGIVALICVLCLWPLIASATPSDTIDDGFVFSAAATGLIVTGSNDLDIGTDRDRIDEDESEDDPGAGTAGFIVVVEGSALIQDEDGPIAVLNQGDALFVAADRELEIQAIEDDATFWRISLSADGDLPGDTDASVDGDPNADSEAMRQVSIRTGLIGSDIVATLGEDDEQVPLVIAIEGDARFADGDDIDEGDLEEADSNQVEADDDATFIGFLAVGPARTFDGSASQPGPTATTEANQGGDGGGDVVVPDPPTNTPEPEIIPTETPTNTPEPIVDTDSDGLSDSEEIGLGTDPNVPDTDLDGLSDGREVNSHGTNPLSTDTDADGLTDGREIDFSANPNDPDTDDDGLGDAFEVNSGFSEATLADTDGDGDDDLAEFSIGTDPRDPACFSGPGSVCQN